MLGGHRGRNSQILQKPFKYWHYYYFNTTQKGSFLFFVYGEI